MAENCKKCFMLKMTPNSKCACSNIKFDDGSRLVTKKKPKAIPQKSEKKMVADKARWKVDIIFKKIASEKCNSKGDGVCEYCDAEFNIQFDCINQTVCFAHILSWREFKPLYMLQNNIAFVCSEKCHKEMDAEICVLWIKPELQRLITNLKSIDVWNLVKYVKN